MSQKEDKARIYNSKEWKLVRLAKIERNPLCEVCESKGKIMPAQAVHHIIPIETATDFTHMKDLAFRYNNLMSVCYTCHSDIHKAMNSRTKEGHQLATAAAIERWAKARQTVEPKNIKEFLDLEREHIKNIPLSEEPFFKDIAEALKD